MKSKYELPFSTTYVPDWGIVEGFRELFQNALDNEITNPENKMVFNYDATTEVLRVCNKTSVLELDSLLLGSTTKANDANTIGRHGEGYKIAFLVLLREGKTVTVYNFGKREVWTTKLVKSKRYNGQMVPVITVEKEAFWKSVPSHDLTIEVGGVSEEEYVSVVSKNLHLRDAVKSCVIPKYGRILTDENERGKLYVKGLYVCDEAEMQYGYDFEPSLIQLDRDRKLIKAFDLIWNTSAMWKIAFAQKELRAELLEMVSNNSKDVRYIKDNPAYDRVGAAMEKELANAVTTRFIRQYGEKAIPVRNNSELQSVQGMKNKAVMVNEIVAKYIDDSEIETESVPSRISISQELRQFMDDVEDKLNYEELDRLEGILNRIREIE